MLTLYRVEATSPRTHEGPRPPGNVPYVVDNLWEWARPDDRPSRRGCLFASPAPELAWQNAGAGADKQLVKLRFKSDAVVVQSCEVDARHHPDCAAGGLRRALFGFLAESLGKDPARERYVWAGLPLAAKAAAAPLFLPTLSRAEMYELLREGGNLGRIAKKLRAAVTFWDTVRRVDLSAAALPYRAGEVFFAADAVAGRKPV